MHHHMQMVNMTPHGLPPITPSMPSFTFLPQMSAVVEGQEGGESAGSGKVKSGEALQSHLLQQQQQEQQSQHQQQLLQQYQQHQQQQQQQHAYVAHFQQQQQQQHPHSPAYHPAHHHILGHPHPHMFSPFTPFSPGVAMSPGALWKGGGGAGGFINPAVGAPVHPQAPHPQASTPQQHPSHPQYAQGQEGQQQGVFSMPPPPPPEELGYFPLVNQIAMTGGEPASYFPPMPLQPMTGESPSQGSSGGSGETDIETASDPSSGSGSGSGSGLGELWRPAPGHVGVEEAEIRKGLESLVMRDQEEKKRETHMHPPQRALSLSSSSATVAAAVNGDAGKTKPERNGLTHRAESDPVSVNGRKGAQEEAEGGGGGEWITVGSGSRKAGMGGNGTGGKEGPVGMSKSVSETSVVWS